MDLQGEPAEFLKVRTKLNSDQRDMSLFKYFSNGDAIFIFQSPWPACDEIPLIACDDLRIAIAER
jgi:hypothetical protein